jgi:hypothetical protein
MPHSPRNYQTLAEFEREEIRPGFKIGFSIDDFEETSFESENEASEQEFQLDSVDSDDESEEEEEDEAFDE